MLSNENTSRKVLGRWISRTSPRLQDALESIDMLQGFLKGFKSFRCLANVWDWDMDVEVGV